MFTEVIDGCLLAETLLTQNHWTYNQIGVRTMYYPFTNFLGHPNVGGFNLNHKDEPYSKVGPNGADTNDTKWSVIKDP